MNTDESVTVSPAPRDMTITDLIVSAEACKAAGHIAQGCDLYKEWIAHHADHPSLHAIYFNYAVSLADVHDQAGAVNALRDAIRLKPDFFPSYINLGGLLERMGRLDQAVIAWQSLVAFLPAATADAVAHKIVALKQMGRVLEAAHAPAAAEAALTQCLDLNQDQPEVVQHLISIRQGQCKWPPVMDAGRITKQRLISGMSPLSTACYTDDPMYHLATAYSYCRRIVGVPDNPRSAFDGIETAPRSGGRLRIGYLSSDLRNHAVGFAMTDILETHDRERFEIFTYYCGIATTDATQDRIRAATDHWIDLTDNNDLQAARRIRRDGIDILVDLNGYTKDSRTRVFAHRPAPVAVNWFGFPNTMGSPYHDYIIADDVVIPPEHEIYFSETVLRLPCYQANDRKRPVAAATPTRADVGLPEHALVFCCLNGMQKITAMTFQRWLLILQHVPNSVLWLLGGTVETQDRLRRTAEQQGVAALRLVFADKRQNPDHLARFRLADLFLDTFPYGAHTTASDALWMGIPVITLRGRSFAARVCASVVRAAGLPELVCDTPNDYVRTAIALGNDLDRLVALRARLAANRDTCLLFDTPLLVSRLEARFQEMAETLRRGKQKRPDLTNLDIYHEIGQRLDLETVELLDDATYRGLYEARLADVNAIYPIQSDNRLWRTGW